jgi:hypothetical protein
VTVFCRVSNGSAGHQEFGIVNRRFSAARHAFLWFISALALAGCGGSSDNSTAPDTSTYTIGGTVSGLSGTVVLQLNGAETLSVSANSSFVFTTGIGAGNTYQVTIKTQPSNQTCVLTYGSGSVVANVTSVLVTCAAATFTVGGTVAGLNGTVVVQNNAADNLTLTSNGNFQFATAVTSFSTYSVTVATQPTAQTCWVVNALGTSTIPITNVQVNCASTIANATVNGSITGLTSSGLVLKLSNNGVVVETLPAYAAGSTSFAFTTNLSTGNYWVVTVGTQPSSPRQTCTVLNGEGYIASTSPTGIQVSCSTDYFLIGGTISVAGGGALADGLVLQNNLGDDLSVAAGSTNFTFATGLTSPSTYSVSIKQQPTGQTCTLDRALGLVTTAGNVTNVALSCLANSMATPLNGTFAVNFAGHALRGFLTFFADGTYVFGLHQADASCNTGTSSTNGNGVEYGVYNWNAASGAFQVVTAPVDTNDKCGLAGAGILASGTLNKAGDGSLSGTLTLPTGSAAVVLTPVSGVTGQLLGAWTVDKLGFVVYGSDNTLFAVNSQALQNYQTSFAGIEDGCLSGAASASASGSFTVNLDSGCTVSGSLTAVDTNGSGGYSAAVGQSTTFSVAGDQLTTQLGTAAPVNSSRISTN